MRTASAQSVDRARYEAFGRRLNDLRTLLHVPGIAAAIIDGDSIVWTMTLGEADIARHIPVTRDTRFPIASITKTITAAVVMQLVAEGKLSLDTLMAQVDPASALPPNVTLAQVLSHTSELGPGAEYMYSGSRFNALTPVVERAAGEPFYDAMRHRVFAPAGLQRPAIARTAADRDTAGLALPYDFDATADSTRPGYAPALGLRAASGVLLSIDDLARYALALERGRLTAPAYAAMMTSVRHSHSGIALPYGLGWFVQQYEGESVWWHYGQESSHASLLLRVPSKHLALVVLTNSATISDAARLLDGNIARSLVAQAFFATVDRLPATATRSRDSLVAEALGELYVGHASRADSLARIAFAPPFDARREGDLASAYLLVQLSDSSLAPATRAMTDAILRDHPTLPPAIYFAAMVRIRAGDARGAMELLDRIATLSPSPRQWSVVQGLTELGALQAKLDPARARVTLQRVIDMNLNFGGAVNRAKQLLTTLPPTDPH